MARKKSPVMLEGDDREMLHALKPLIEDAYRRAGRTVPKISFPWIIRAALTLFLDVHQGRRIVATSQEVQEVAKRCQIMFGKQVLHEHGIEVVAVDEEGEGKHVRFVTRPTQDAEMRSFDFPLSEAAEIRSMAVN